MYGQGPARFWQVAAGADGGRHSGFSGDCGLAEQPGEVTAACASEEFGAS